MTKEIVLTAQQLSVVNHDGAQIVVAGAGTGKTETLTQHILYLLLEKEYALHEVVAITFTDKAAGEMRERVYMAICAKVLIAQDDAAKMWLSKLQINFSAQNRITTIDGFNASLLAAYPEHSPLPVDYQIVDDYSKFLLDTQTKQAMFSALEKDEKLSETFQDFLSLYEQMGQTRLFKRVTALASESIDDLAELTKDILREEFETRLRGLVNSNSQELWDSYVATVPRFIPQGLRELLMVEENAGEILTNTGTFRKSWLKKHLQYAEVVQAWPSKSAKCFKTWQELTNNNPYREGVNSKNDNVIEADWQCHQALRKLASLALLYKKHQQQTIRQHGKVRFEDVASAALEMLEENPQLRDEIRGGIKHILVDEFQDTSDAQWNLINILRGDNNVMLVGDPKQSIYRFRGADVTVFDRVRKTEFSEDEQRELTFSQRSQPSLTRFYNALFFDVLSTDENRAEYEAAFQELQSQKLEEPESGVTWIDSSYEENENEEVNTPEALTRFLYALQEDSRKIARNEKTLLLPQYQKISELISKDESGVIGILCVTHSQKSAFEKTLRDNGVQVSSYHGRGFYNSMPVLLAINLARLFYNQNDNLALAGILRSPLCGLSDDMLMRLSLYDKELWNALGEAAASDVLFPLEHEFLCQVHAMLGAWCDASRVLPFSDVLENVWRDSWLSFYHALENDGDQQQENFSKLIDILRRAQQSSEYGLVEIVEFLQKLREEKASESQAELPEGGAVQLMTIHAAKGLGFDMTILPQLDKSGGAQKADVRSELLGIPPHKYFSINTVDGTENQESTLWTILKNEDRARDIAEIKRQLYVACTRSREHLVLIMPKTPRDNSWEKWIETHLLTHCYKQFTLDGLKELTPGFGKENSSENGDVELVVSVEAPLDGTELPTEISTSQLLDHLFPQAEKDIDLVEDRETQELPVGAKRRGSLIHRLLEWDGKSTYTAIENLMWSNHLPVSDANRMQKLAQDVHTKLLELLLDHKTAKQEFAFVVPAASLCECFKDRKIDGALRKWLEGNNNWCNGIIDYLAPLENGGYAILDFKTHWNPAMQHSDSTRERIKMQLQIYAVASRQLELDVKKLYAMRIYGSSGKIELEEVE